jgi:hypothetical protein
MAMNTDKCCHPKVTTHRLIALALVHTLPKEAAYVYEAVRAAATVTPLVCTSHSSPQRLLHKLTVSSTHLPSPPQTHRVLTALAA